MSITDVLVPLGPILVQIFSIMLLVSYIVEHSELGLVSEFGSDLSYTSLVLLTFFLTILPKVIKR